MMNSSNDLGVQSRRGYQSYSVKSDGRKKRSLTIFSTEFAVRRPVGFSLDRESSHQEEIYSFVFLVACGGGWN